MQKILLALITALVITNPARANQSISFPMDERLFRGAGIELINPKIDDTPDELSFPGVVVVPQNQLRIIASSSNALLESLIVTPDEDVQKNQVLAFLRSPDLVLAQREFLESFLRHSLSVEKLKRDEQLFNDKVIAERRLLVTRSEENVAKALMLERRQQLILLGLSKKDVEKLERTQEVITRLAIFSPIDGTVLTRHVQQGERVAENQPILTIAQLDPLWVNIQVPVSKITAISVGNEVELPGFNATGHVLRIGRNVDPSSQSITVIAEIKKNVQNIRPNQALFVDLRVNSRNEKIWSLPSSSVVRHRERPWVFVRNETGFTARQVSIISENTQNTSVVMDISETDQVAFRGILSLLARLAESDR